ncbi:alpha/beta fold hydrolase [Actinomadura sp. 9N407]|uniref:alpha/beta fold hydrolase n=1 Tax=Actinomadura sp. 9N407 TaxID=3375154 RepID=UPI0037BAB36D
MPILVIPGGPGVASVLPYRGFRKQAARRELDVLMVEHRGVGLSRTDTTGADLAIEQVTIENAADDLAAVLDAAAVERAVVYGASYGSYLAQVFGVRYPERVAGMVLDSPILSADDVDTVRAYRRGLLWDGTGRASALLRELVGSGKVPVAEAGHVVQVVYEFAGPATLERLLAARLRGRARRTWRWVAELGAGEIDGPGSRYVMEPELVAGISYGQLGYGAAPDGLPLDPEEVFADAARRGPAFAGFPVDMLAELPGFHWPTAVVSGERDLRTPRPVAERVVGLLPEGVLVPLPGTAHSAFDIHPLAALHIAHAVAAGTLHRLPRLAPRIAALPRRGGAGLVGPMIAGALALELAGNGCRGGRGGRGGRGVVRPGEPWRTAATRVTLDLNCG